MMLLNFTSENQFVAKFKDGIEVFIKREDLIHPVISGNKYRKLKYNLIEARRQDQHQLLTYGGAFSNHIAAVAAAGTQFNFKTIGIIRGEELEHKIATNPTLSFAQNSGMQLKFVTRDDFRRKNDADFRAGLQQEFGDFYNIPEGGTNTLAVKGCTEILTEGDDSFDVVCCSVGTGGTISGLINALLPHQSVLGFPALKGDFLSEEICKFAKSNQWVLNTDYHFGGYGKVTPDLIEFMNGFKAQHHLQLDPIYTGKMLFGIYDLIDKGYFKRSTKILAIHTGGLQGIEGMNLKLKQQNKPLIV
ncbi:1-aminocyclopropane-1-carboxylate deaminase/D-cysteine desulfhydrase [Sediminibacter sp. Hel_I_10]|uniref:1-aminocyclopropane-1-carboxylate deaminase/D-cysteine desulfhydrase n=1 Tax=Sediminibacter sp. Hel_I_10 TaxID=1392490 RepID=UPI0009DD386E